MEENQKPNQIITSPSDKLAAIRELVENGILTDGGHHKQWYLVKIGEVVGIDINVEIEDQGIPD